MTKILFLKVKNGRHMSGQTPVKGVRRSDRCALEAPRGQWSGGRLRSKLRALDCERWPLAAGRGHACSSRERGRDRGPERLVGAGSAASLWKTRDAAREPASGAARPQRGARQPRRRRGGRARAWSQSQESSLLVQRTFFFLNWLGMNPRLVHSCPSAGVCEVSGLCPLPAAQSS